MTVRYEDRKGTVEEVTVDNERHARAVRRSKVRDGFKIVKER